MSEVEDTSMTSSLKRTSSTDALGANSKRRDTAENAEIDMLPIPVSNPLSDRSILDFLYWEYGMEILSSKVENNSQLKQMAEELFQSVKNGVKHGGQAATTLFAQVKKLFESSAFIQMFVEAYKKDTYLLVDIEVNSKEAQDEERMENLKTDTWGALAIVLGYWSDPAFYHKLIEAIKESKRKNAEPRVEVVEKEDRIINLNVPSNIEGLKAALATKYDKDKYERMLEEIDRDKSNFEKILGPCYGAAQQRITWLSILWRNESFSLRAIGYGEPPLIPPYVCNE
ncbi:hypothetical protein PHJA_000464900 [Phtheirospermum japonicum]|uniref:Uncharacterized protein n=1 Tax=Phtheirospermum japonicum TaxID=374723 RepID=A0A830BH38_9LAMI|nr:hypothetical protein PHJA_000464900 [Phtheirospermum japonicum]